MQALFLRVGPVASWECLARNLVTSFACLSAGLSGVHTGPGCYRVHANATRYKMGGERSGVRVNAPLSERVVEERFIPEQASDGPCIHDGATVTP